MSIPVILLILALILFVIAAFNVPSPIGLVPLGLAFVVAAQLFGAGIFK